MSNKLSAVKLANIYDDANNYSLQLSDDKTFPYKAYVAGATFEATKSLEQLQAKDAEIEALKRAIGIRDEVMAKKDADLDRANNFSTKVGDAYYLRQTSLSEKDEEIGRLDAVIKSQGKLFNQLDAEVTSCRRTIAGHESAYDSVRKELLERDADIAGLKAQLVQTVKELTQALDESPPLQQEAIAFYNWAITESGINHMGEFCNPELWEKTSRYQLKPTEQLYSLFKEDTNAGK